MLIQLWAIVRVSILETLGRPVALLLTFSAAVWGLLLPLLQFQRFSEEGRMARDCGLAMAFLFGLIFIIGNAGRLARSLEDGTAATVFVKPVSRGLWVCGRAVGGMVSAGFFLFVQLGIVMMAEAYSAKYQTTGEYADVVQIFTSVGCLILALITGACNQRFRGGRFVLTSNVCLLLFVWGRVMMLAMPHWGILTAGLTLYFGLLQLAAVATFFAMWFRAGGIAAATGLVTLGWAFFLNGASYLQLDALSKGGAVTWGTIGMLLPQTIFLTAFMLWCGMMVLRHRTSL